MRGEDISAKRSLRLSPELSILYLRCGVDSDTSFYQLIATFNSLFEMLVFLKACAT